MNPLVFILRRSRIRLSNTVSKDQEASVQMHIPVMAQGGGEDSCPYLAGCRWLGFIDTSVLFVAIRT